MELPSSQATRNRKITVLICVESLLVYLIGVGVGVLHFVMLHFCVCRKLFTKSLEKETRFT